MVRRAILAIAVVCGGTAAGALAFASDIAGFGSHFTERPALRMRGFTPVPHASTGPLSSEPNEVASGRFCRFRPADAEAVAGPPAAPSVGGTASSRAPLVLEGQSTIPDSLPPALCTGEPATATTTLAPGVKPIPSHR